MAEPAMSHPDNTVESVRITLSGHVQGVGFRPFVYRLAVDSGIVGQVQNCLGEVDVVASGSPEALQKFEDDLITKAPPLSRPTITRILHIEPRRDTDFTIAASSADADARIFVPPDYFMCEDCRRELLDPADRRYRYPFINCTQCGPRYTLIEALPYDRPNTSMASFMLCPECEREYLDPLDRRFHAEPVACPICGPRLLWQRTGDERAEADAALELAIAALEDGAIIGVKGIGGYHLVCDASNEEAVSTLRARKRRPDKPLAVMFPLAGDDGLDVVRRHARVLPNEAELLVGPVRPIVLVTRRPSSTLASNVAPGLREIGAFLPYSPVHQLLLESFGRPIIATSGNISGEPVLTQNDEVERRLSNVADGFLHHDRPIVRPADDPVFRRIDERLRPLRMGRGCAPVELRLPWKQPRPLLATGGHMKGALALSWGERVVVSPHIGEMDSPRSLAVFEQVAEDLQGLYGVRAEAIVCDAHPGYTTSQWANRQEALPVETVWHHEAHASAVAAEFDQKGRWLVFTWDGVGLGSDGGLWGGEAFLGSAGDWRRVCSLRPFRLPGGEKAGREPWRSAAALHWECGRKWPDCPDKDGLAEVAWRRGLNSPATSAAGRLFDAAAALICGTTETSFEAQGPMQLETLARTPRNPVYLSLLRRRNGVLCSDWEPLLEVIGDNDRSPRERSEIFHATIAQVIVQQACRLRYEHDIDHVGLSGGVFQNRVLTELAVEGLSRRGFQVCVPEKLPVNDAALCYGQAAHFAAVASER